MRNHLVRLASVVVVLSAWPAIAAAQEAPAGPERAQLRIRIQVGRQAGEGRVRVLRADGTPAAEGPAGQTLSVPPGRYTIVVRCTSLADQPERRQADVALAAGAPVEHTSEFPAGTIKIIVTRGGRPVQAEVVLKLEGGDEAVARARSGEDIRISPGVYEATITFQRRPLTVRGIRSMEDAAQEYRFAI